MPDQFSKDQQHVYRASLLLEIEWLEHGFGTRHSAGLNQCAELIGLNQIHSCQCVYADGRRIGRIGQGDALLTGVPAALIGVRTADCVPILLADPSRKAVAAVHAGWRGTVQGIAARAVAAMVSRFGSQPGDLRAAIGPSIGSCCYEVGPEVAGGFRDLFPERADLGGRTRLDLPEANRRQLLAAGLSRNRVWVCGLCTSCLAEEFFSWRRERQMAGRMVSAIAIKPIK